MLQSFDNFIQAHPGVTFFIILAFVFGAMITYYAKFTITVMRWTAKPVKGKDGRMRPPKLSTAEKLKCYVPLLQAVMVHKRLYLSAGPFGVMSVISVVCIVIRVLNAFLLPVNELVMFSTVILAYVGVLLLLFVYSFITASTANMYGFSAFKTFIAFILPPIGAWYLSTAIPGKMIAMHKEDVFSEHKSETIIKSKSN